MSMEKNVLDMKIVSGFHDDELLSDIHFRLQEFDFHHINVEIQKPNEKYLGNCTNLEEF